MITETDLDNLLVRQKDSIISLINDGRITEAKTVLLTVSPMWIALDYSYKIKELEKRMTDACGF